MLNTFLTRIEALRLFSQQEETRCDVFCLSDVVVAVGDRWLAFDDFRVMKERGLISVRLEHVPCAPMGARTPPIRHVSLTALGRLVVGRQRPEVMGVRKPLASTDPEEWWAEDSLRLGVTVEDLRAQVALADELLAEIFAEEGET